MRSLKSILLLLAVGGVIPIAAQQPAQTASSGTPPSRTAGPIPVIATPVTPPHPQATQKSDQRALPVASTANAPEVNNSTLRPVQGELETNLDSKAAKPGDPVVVKTVARATTSNGVVIPSGSKIVGKVVDVQSAGDANHGARVTVAFDRAQLATGRKILIQSVLQSVAPANAAAALPVGGEAVATTTDPTSTQGAPAPATDTKAATGKRTGTVVEKQGNVAIKTTGVSGVLIATNADGKPFSNASGALLGSRQDVRLAGGTRVVLAVAPNSATGARTER